MLSGESAKGKFPITTIRTMNEIILAAEGYANSGGLGSFATALTQPFIGPKTPESSIAKGAVIAAEETDASAILVLKNSMDLSRLVSAYRPKVPIITLCETNKMARQLILHRGIHPIVGLKDVPRLELPSAFLKVAKEMGKIEEGQTVVMVSIDDDDKLGHSECMRVLTVP